MSTIINEANVLRDSGATPMMEQYLEVKDQYRNYILMYRLGDFYEMFFEDAILASRELELTLTGRDCGDDRRAAMCGVPFHKVDDYVGRLVEKGYKVAICEQTEDPKAAVGLVKREVIRVVTPGTVTDGALLAEGQNNYLAALAFTERGLGLGFCDVSTGCVNVTFLSGSELLTRAENEIGTYQPREVLMNVEKSALPELTAFLTDRIGAVIEDRRDAIFSDAAAKDAILRLYGADALSRFTDPAEIAATGALVAYVRETQKCDVAFLRELTVYEDGQYMDIDAATRRNLELVETMRAKEKKGSLLWVLDRTETSMGARLLRNYILRPLLSPAAIMSRQSAVDEFFGDAEKRDAVRAALSHIYDIERLTARAVYKTANARDLRAIGQSLAAVPEVIECLRVSRSPRLREIYETTDVLGDLSELLLRAIAEEPPLSVREGGLIRDGYNGDVDYLRSVATDGKTWIERIEEEERAATGIKSLRVGYNKVFGYYVEVSKSYLPEVPDRYIRKQTLANCERFITQELKDMEATILGAADKLCAIEYEIFASVRDKVAEASEKIQALAAIIAETDVYMSLGDVAARYRYVRPEIDLSPNIVIKDGRHPVVERFVDAGYFVPNDTELDQNANRLMMITGPNMAGKSTYMRQVALITLMAQIGSFVPAREARIGVVDKIFTRVGASDDLAAGQSTFMLEMSEVANILRNATPRSLIIYDEVGRGTSTYDGMSIARAVAEYSVGKKLGAKTLFATHYHELTVMERLYPGVVNYNIAAKKRGDGIIFLRKIVRGATDDSYGIEVAKLAGLPSEVVRRAKEILAEIESGGGNASPVVTPKAMSLPPEEDLFTALQNDGERQVADKIRSLDVNTLTPIEAMSFIYDMQKILSGKLTEM